jgi:hypothetical protein
MDQLRRLGSRMDQLRPSGAAWINFAVLGPVVQKSTISSPQEKLIHAGGGAARRRAARQRWSGRSPTLSSRVLQPRGQPIKAGVPEPLLLTYPAAGRAEHRQQEGHGPSAADLGGTDQPGPFQDGDVLEEAGQSHVMSGRQLAYRPWTRSEFRDHRSPGRIREGREHQVQPPIDSHLAKYSRASYPGQGGTGTDAFRTHSKLSTTVSPRDGSITVSLRQQSSSAWHQSLLGFKVSDDIGRRPPDQCLIGVSRRPFGQKFAFRR